VSILEFHPLYRVIFRVHIQDREVEGRGPITKSLVWRESCFDHIFSRDRR